MKHLKLGIAIIFLNCIFALAGCFKAMVETREPLPDIVWPKYPETPRIRFVNAISGPEDLNITESAYKKFQRFFKDEIENSIAPLGLATDKDDRLFVVDTFNRYVHVLDPKNGTYYTFPHQETSLVSPVDIAIDIKGNIYVSDSKKAVVKIFKNHGTEYIKEIGEGVFERPTGLAVNEKTGELLVVDTIASEILRYDIDNYKFKGRIGGKGTESGMFYYPTNIFVSSDGNIFVTDSLNFRIQVFTPEGKFINAFGKPGDSPGYFARPRGAAVDSDGNIYVVDALFDNVQIFDREGKLLMAFGGPGSGYGEFWLPSGIFIDSKNRIYVSDSYNKRVQVFQYIKGDELLYP